MACLVEFFGFHFKGIECIFVFFRVFCSHSDTSETKAMAKASLLVALRGCRGLNRSQCPLTTYGLVVVFLVSRPGSTCMPRGDKITECWGGPRKKKKEEIKKPRLVVQLSTLVNCYDTVGSHSQTLKLGSSREKCEPNCHNASSTCSFSGYLGAGA